MLKIKIKKLTINYSVVYRRENEARLDLEATEFEVRVSYMKGT